MRSPNHYWLTIGIVLLLLTINVGDIVSISQAEFSKGASLSSTNFKVLDPQHGSFGGISSSSSGAYILIGSIGDIAIGSSSITNFKLRSGFLYYPKVISPTLNTATAGDGQVALSWSTATAYQGWTVGGYNVCHKSTGSYTCVDVGNVTSSTKTGLTNGTTYTFKIEVNDGLSNVIAESNEKTSAPVATATPTPTPTSTPSSGGGGGGGGGGGFIPPVSGTGTGSLNVQGVSYPRSTVNIYIDSLLRSTIRTDVKGQFTAEFKDLSVGSHTLSIDSADVNGRKSITVSYNFQVIANSTTSISNVLVPTTIELSAYQLSKGEILRIFGQAPAVSEVDIHVFSDEFVNKISADSNGSYELSFNTQALENNTHTTKSRAILNQITGPFSQVLQFVLGKGGLSKTADVNKDGRVNVVDFSILLYWWNTQSSRGLDIADINKDGKINIIDFSIMLFQWTG